MTFTVIVRDFHFGLRIVGSHNRCPIWLEVHHRSGILLREALTRVFPFYTFAANLRKTTVGLLSNLDMVAGGESVSLARRVYLAHQ